MTKSLGDRIRELREQRDLSLRELARKVSVSAAFMSDVELGKRNPSTELLRSIAKELHIPFDELRAFDARASLAELKELAAKDPSYGFAFRRLVDENITSQELTEFLNEQAQRKKKK